MTATYTPEVAAARWRMKAETVLVDINGPDYREVTDADLRLLLADHARLAEEVAKLRRVAKAAKETLDGVLCLCAEGTEFMGKIAIASAVEKDMKPLSAALAALEVQNDKHTTKNKKGEISMEQQLTPDLIMHLREAVDDASFAEGRGGNVNACEHRLAEKLKWRVARELLDAVEELQDATEWAKERGCDTCARKGRSCDAEDEAGDSVNGIGCPRHVVAWRYRTLPKD